MSTCKHCNAQVQPSTTLEWQTGKKKDGSPWKAWVCPMCTKYNFVNQAKPKQATPPATVEDKRLKLLCKATDITIAQLRTNPEISILSALEINLRHLIEVYKGRPTAPPPQDTGTITEDPWPEEA